MWKNRDRGCVVERAECAGAIVMVSTRVPIAAWVATDIIKEPRRRVQF